MATVTAAVYEVGPGYPLAHVNDVPWEALHAGDRVLIYWQPVAYRAKWVLCARGTKERPIRVSGVPGPSGVFPTIDGQDAKTRRQLNFWGEERAVIKVGGANRPADTTPAHLIIENLNIRGGQSSSSFDGRDGRSRYRKNAAGIYIEKGEHITIRNCTIFSNGNGIISAPATRELLVEHCHLHGNGNRGSLYEHNVYTTGIGVTFQFNRFGPLQAGSPGNNLKDRSAGLVVRYNWIEGGNRCLDLVDADDVSISRHPRYEEAFVYGNVLLKTDGVPNNQVVHYGGDSGETARYRNGVLYFFNNTVVSSRIGNTQVFRQSGSRQRIDCRNNIFFTQAYGRHLILNSDTGDVSLSGNWMKEHWQYSPGRAPSNEMRLRNSDGASPGFADFSNGDFTLGKGSACIGIGMGLADNVLPENALEFQYFPHQQRRPRKENGMGGKAIPDIGAFEAR